MKAEFSDSCTKDTFFVLPGIKIIMLIKDIFGQIILLLRRSVINILKNFA